MNEITLNSISLDKQFCKMPIKEQMYVSEMHACVNEVISNIPQIGVRKAIERASLSRQNMKYFSIGSIRAKYYEYTKSNCDWRVLTRLWKGRESSLPQEFKDWYLSFLFKAERDDTVLARIQTLKRLWLNNHPIAGYGEPLKWWRINRPHRQFPTGTIVRDCDFPMGWSDGNLQKIASKHSAVKTLVKRGFHIAHSQFRDQNWRDTSKLRPLEYLTFDDVRLDIQVVEIVDGKPQVCYVNAIFALDIGTRKIVDYLTKARLELESSKHLGLSRQETKTLLLNILSNKIPSNYKMNILMENASATLETEDRKLLANVFKNHLNLEYTGLTRFDITGQCGFIEKGGQPWYKGWIESLFRKLHTIMNGLPGTTGNRYDNKPAELEGKMKYTLTVLREAKKQGVDFDGLWLPLLTRSQLEAVLKEIIFYLNTRVKHKLQGFDYADEFMHKDTKQIASFNELQLMSPSERIGWIATQRPESPIERWNKLSLNVDWVQVPTGILRPLYNSIKTVTVRNGRVEIQDKNYGIDRLIFTDSLLLDFESQKLVAGIAQDYSHMNLWDNKGRFVGTVERINRINMADKNAILERSGEVHRAREQDHYQSAREIRREETLEILAGKLYNERALPTLRNTIERKENKELENNKKLLKNRQKSIEKARQNFYQNQASTAYILDDDSDF